MTLRTAQIQPYTATSVKKQSVMSVSVQSRAAKPLQTGLLSLAKNSSVMPSKPAGYFVSQVESGVDSKPEVEIPTKVQDALTQYNTSVASKQPNATVFNDFLPLRKWLTKTHPEQVKAYDALVEKTVAAIRFYETSKPLEFKNPTPQKNKSLVEDAATKYLLVAKGIVELYFYRPDVIEKTVLKHSLNPQDKPKKLYPMEITINNSDKGDHGGVVYRNENQIGIDANAFWKNLSKQSNNSLVLTHEFSHALDFSDSKADGVPENLINNPEDQQIFLKAKDKLFEIFKEKFPAYSNPKQPLPLYSWDSETGLSNAVLRHYAFINEREYWAVLAQTFLENPALLAQGVETKELYQLLVKHFGFDPLEFKK